MSEERRSRPPDPAAATLPPAAPPDPNATLPPDPAAAPTVPGGPDGAEEVSIPGYQVLATLGRGGMGVVYQARQVRLNRLVALKMILSGAHAGADELARFRTEAEVIARLQHPNIVQIHEVGEHGGLPFFSLEFCPGGSLERKLGGTPLPPREAAGLVETLARAMQAAHAKGIIHRDLKPANVLLSEGGTPKVTDFGLARKLDEAGRTASGAVMGTPSYMAPEQAGGESKALGPACDVYALGAVLYECLTGRPPFKAATALDTILQVVSDEPVAPRQLQSKTPRDLETICLKCLRKEPPRRYPSAAALADDLGRFLRGEPIRARAMGRGERVVKWARRRPAVAALLAALVAVSATGLAGIGWAYWQAVTERDRARGAEQRAEGLHYATQLELAQGAWKEGNLPLARAQLESTRPDFRGWEYHYLAKLYATHPRILGGHTAGVLSVGFSPDGRHVASGGQDGMVKVWDVVEGREVLSLGLPARWVDGLRKWGPEKVEKVPAAAGAGVQGVCFSPDGRRLAAGGGDLLMVWDLATGRDLLTIRGRHFGDLSGVSFSPDGKRLACASKGYWLEVWDPKPEDGPGEGWKHGITQGEVKLWDAATGEQLLTLRGHTGPVFGVSFSPDGKRLACAGSDQIVKVWDAASGQEVLTLHGHTDRVTRVAFSPDGKRLASASHDGTVRVWDADDGPEARSAPDPPTP